MRGWLPRNMRVPDFSVILLPILETRWRKVRTAAGKPNLVHDQPKQGFRPMVTFIIICSKPFCARAMALSSYLEALFNCEHAAAWRAAVRQRLCPPPRSRYLPPIFMATALNSEC